MVDEKRSNEGEEEIPPNRHVAGNPQMDVIVAPEGANLRSEGLTGDGTGSTNPYEPTGDLAAGVDGPENTRDEGA